MYAAIFEIGMDIVLCEGDTAMELYEAACERQDFHCVLNMGAMYEKAAGKKELKKLIAFLEKADDGTLTVDDIKALDVHLSIGNIRCRAFAEGEEEITTLKPNIEIPIFLSYQTNCSSCAMK